LHTVWADHPALDTLGLFSLGAKVDVTPQVMNTVPLAIPSFGTLRQRICGAAGTADSTTGFVFGAVHADTLGTSRPGAVVNIGWRADNVPGTPGSAVTGMADSTGNYVVCGVPGARELTIWARDGAIATPPAAFRLGAVRIVHRDLMLSAMATLAEGVADTSAMNASGTMHTLRVVSADGNPVVFANVSIGGGTTRITNDKGELPLGAGRLHNATTSVKRIGFAAWFGTIDFPDSASVVTITLTHAAAQYLAEVRVTGQKTPYSPMLKGFYDRWIERQKGLLSAVFIGPEELEFRHPDEISAVLRGLNGVDIKLYNGPGALSGGHRLMAMSMDAPNCPMAIVIDGKQHYPDIVPGTGPPHGDPVYATFLDQIIPVSEIMAIEVYPRGGNMPISLQVDDNRCGVIAFWTGSRR
jgi:hypothetical protein